MAGNASTARGGTASAPHPCEACGSRLIRLIWPIRRTHAPRQRTRRSQNCVPHGAGIAESSVQTAPSSGCTASCQSARTIRPRSCAIEPPTPPIQLAIQINGGSTAAGSSTTAFCTIPPENHRGTEDTAFCTIPPENHRGAEGTEVAQRSQWKEGIRRTQSPAQDGIDLVRVFTPYLALALRESLWHRPFPSMRAQPACLFAFSVRPLCLCGSLDDLCRILGHREGDHR